MVNQSLGGSRIIADYGHGPLVSMSPSDSIARNTGASCTGSISLQSVA